MAARMEQSYLQGSIQARQESPLLIDGYEDTHRGHSELSMGRVARAAQGIDTK